ncbi:MAG: hypothetical protein ACREBD_15855 [Blastocatellia bacterium]
MRAKGVGFFAAAETWPYQPSQLGFGPVSGQLKDDSCVAACVLTLLQNQGRDDLYEAMLRAALDIQGEGALLSDAPHALLTFGSTVAWVYRDDLTLNDLKQALAKGPVIVALRRSSLGSHALLIDGIEADSYALIRDPLPELTGSAYKVALETFLPAWLPEQSGRGRGVIVK